MQMKFIQYASKGSRRYTAALGVTSECAFCFLSNIGKILSHAKSKLQALTSSNSIKASYFSYLRSHSSEEGGAYSSSFLAEESWEDYLVRMERSGEWGDHIIMQALVDVFCLEVVVFNVFQEDIRRTEVIAESKKRFSNRLTIYLGHLGEFHYMSLRPKNWLRYWPYSRFIQKFHPCKTITFLTFLNKLHLEVCSTT